jgi:hypothetical protein
MRRFKTVATYDKPSTNSLTSPSIDLLQLIDSNINSKEDFSDSSSLEAPSSTVSSNLLLKRDTQSYKKKHPGWVNPWYQITQSRIRGGDPDLDKFNPHQPGQFPNLIQGLPLPEVRCK